MPIYDALWIWKSTGAYPGRHEQRCYPRGTVDLPAQAVKSV